MDVSRIVQICDSCLDTFIFWQMLNSSTVATTILLCRMNVFIAEVVLGIAPGRIPHSRAASHLLFQYTGKPCMLAFGSRLLCDSQPETEMPLSTQRAVVFAV